MIELKYLKRKDNLRTEIEKEHQIKYCLSSQCVSEGIVLPYIRKEGKILGGVIDSNEKFINNSKFNEKVGGSYKPSSIINIDKKAIFIGNLVFPAWGHVITDDIKYLWWLRTEKFKEIKSNGDFVLVCIKSHHIKDTSNFSFFLSLLGGNPNLLLMIDKPTKFRYIYIPEPSFSTTVNGEKRWSIEFYNTINEIKSTFIKDTTFYDRIYLSRTKIKGHRDFGERYVEQAFAQAGYYVVHPEDISIECQINMLRQANIVVVTEGSIAHNAVFMRNSATLVILRKADYINYYQVAINEINNLNIIYIDAFLSIFNNKKTPIVGPFFIYVNNRVAKFLGIKRKFPLWEFLRYIRWSIFHRDILERINWI